MSFTYIQHPLKVSLILNKTKKLVEIDVFIMVQLKLITVSHESAYHISQYINYHNYKTNHEQFLTSIIFIK